MLVDKAITFSDGIQKKNNEPCHWLVDCRAVMTTSKGAKLISKLLGEKLKSFNSKYILGCQLSGNPLVSFMVLQSKKNKR